VGAFSAGGKHRLAAQKQALSAYSNPNERIGIAYNTAKGGIH